MWRNREHLLRVAEEAARWAERSGPPRNNHAIARVLHQYAASLAEEAAMGRFPNDEAVATLRVLTGFLLKALEGRTLDSDWETSHFGLCVAGHCAVAATSKC